MTTPLSDVALLYRRAGFGADATELEAAAAAGFEATVERLIAGLSGRDPTLPPRVAPFVAVNRGRGGNTWDQYVGLVNWWVDKMASTTVPLREKLTLLLHGQFPTGFTKVGVPVFMYQQNQLFRTLGPGSFADLMLAVAKDPAMLIWLDTDTDVNSGPNENFARELMERFTMGVGTFSQSDVREAARAFTGWSYNDKGAFVLNEWAHDFGDKVFLGYHGDLDGDDIVSIVTRTATSARWVSARMWSWLAFPVDVSHPVVGDLASGYARDLNMTNLLRSIFLHPAFRSPESYRGLVKQPAEWIAGIMRGFGLRAKSFEKSGGTGYLLWVLGNLGQTLFDPPNVGGWGSNQYWLSTAASVAQLNFAQSIAQTANLTAVEEASGPDRIDMLGRLLGVVNWSNQSRSVLDRVRDDPPSLVTLALTAPEVMAN